MDGDRRPIRRVQGLAGLARCRHQRAATLPRLRIGPLGPRNESGFPDLVLVRRPRVIFAELKAERGRLLDAQRDWLAALRDCSVESYLWRPSDWPEIERVLR